MYKLPIDSPNLMSSTVSSFLNRLSEYRPNEGDMARAVLGRKPKLPTWVPAAKAAGWTPPAGWDESSYEK